MESASFRPDVLTAVCVCHPPLGHTLTDCHFPSFMTSHFFSCPVPTFAKELENTTAVLGREATISCAIHNLGNFKVAWVRVDTQTILTIDDSVITRSQRISVRHMSDASIDPDHHHKQRQHHPHATRNHHPPPPPLTADTQLITSGSSSSIHKTWQLIIRDVQSSDAGLYVRPRLISWANY